MIHPVTAPWQESQWQGLKRNFSIRTLAAIPTQYSNMCHNDEAISTGRGACCMWKESWPLANGRLAQNQEVHKLLVLLFFPT